MCSGFFGDRMHETGTPEQGFLCFLMYEKRTIIVLR